MNSAWRRTPRRRLQLGRDGDARCEALFPNPIPTLPYPTLPSATQTNPTQQKKERGQKAKEEENQPSRERKMGAVSIHPSPLQQMRKFLNGEERYGVCVVCRVGFFFLSEEEVVVRVVVGGLVAWGRRRKESVTTRGN